MNLVTPTGRLIDPANPRPEDITIEDIAKGLAKEKRFGGNTLVPYSVAQHSVHVAELCRTIDDSPLAVKKAFLHDASEAFLGDIVQPLKRILPDYRELEAEWMDAIAKRFDLPSGFQHDPIVKECDQAIFVCEATSLVENLSNYRLTQEEAVAVKASVIRSLPSLVDDLAIGSVWDEHYAAARFLRYAHIGLNLK